MHQNFVANLRVELDDLEFFVSELVGLGQDAIGYADFADIVHQGAFLQGCKVLGRQPEPLTQGNRILHDALAVARINVERHGLHERVHLVQSDALAGVPGPWDLILCNPPYVNAQSMAQLPAEYRAEPELALAGGTDGMDFIRRLLRAAPACMREDAVLVLEIGNERAHFEAAFPQCPVFWLEASAGEDQVLLITRSALADFLTP